MTLLLTWVVFPLVALVLSLGCGLLVEFATGRPLPGVLIAPAGFAVIVVAGSLTTMWPTTATATAPVMVGLTVAGYGLGIRRRRPDPAAAAAAAGVFAVYAAPIVLAGSATFAGYITLDDTSTWLALTDNLMAHGRSIAHLAPLTFSTVLNDYFSAGYPLGAYVPLGVGHVLTRQDSAWIFQPEIAFVASMLSLPLYSVTAPLVRSRALRAGAAFLGAQAALLYGYSFWSGIKEITAAALVALAIALVAALPDGQSRWRDAVPLAVAGAAVVDTLAIVGLVWFGVLGAVAVGLLFTRHRRRAAYVIGAVAAGGALLALPALTQARAFLRVANSGDITSSGAAGLGNLLHPLSYLQILGIWPTGDFRTRPQSMGLTYVLLAAVLGTAVVAVVVGVRRRAWGVPLLVAVMAGGAFTVALFRVAGHGSPWLDGKALGTASPAVLACAAAGCAVLLERGRYAFIGAFAGAAIAVGVLWSNALAYENVWLAPRSQLAELESIGHRFAGASPALMTEYQPYGVRHFLRHLDAEGASERRARLVQLRTGGTLDKGQYADIDQFALDAITVYQTLVLRTSPIASRPPSVYVPVWSGRYYEVWERAGDPQTILEHLPLGTSVQASAPAQCTDVRQIAALAAGNGATLVTSERPDAIVADLSAVLHPPRWQTTSSGQLIPHGNGSVTVTVYAPDAGPYQVWLGGSFRGTVTIKVDGRSVGSQTAQLSESGQLVPFGSALLQKGTHAVEIAYTRDRLGPGQGSYQFGFGPLYLGRPATSAVVAKVAPADAESLCGKTLDWIEAVKASS